MSDKQSILDDPRMDGTIWNAADEVTEGMLAAWPAWEACDSGAISLAPPVIRPSLSEIRAADLVFWRPLRLPGMNANGEIAAKDMTTWHFARVMRWQRCHRESPDPTMREWGPSDGSNAGLPWTIASVRPEFDDEFWRPAIFARVSGERLDLASVSTGAFMRGLFEQEASTLGDTIDQLKGSPLASIGDGWVAIQSATRHALLCALTNADPSAAVLEQSGQYIRLRVPSEYEPHVVLSMWDWHGVWLRLLELNARESEMLDEIRACEDCHACVTDMDGANLRCNDENGPGPLTSGHLTRRHPNCPRVGTVATWPRNGMDA